MSKYKLKCITCEKIYEPDEVEYTCPACGNRMGTLEVIYDYEDIKINREEFSKYESIWQFEKILPIEKDSYRTLLHVGGTPLYDVPKLSEELGLKQLIIKYDGTNPTASYKDRASAIAITKAYEKGYDTIYCASTGNAASSLAGLTAPTKLKTFIFLPASAPIAKISQLFIYGANVIPIDGSYDEAFDISMQIGEEKGWYCRNSAINPYLLEGKKTGALEIAVQNSWNIPDYVLVSVGDGTVISSFYKGFYDFYKLGLIDKIPKIIGVQAEGAAAIKRVYDKGEPFLPDDIETHTIADSISVGKPRDIIKACKYVKASGGYFISVSDKEILNAIYELSLKTGIFGEPAGAAAYAGLKKISGKLKGYKVAIVITGNGLKDVKAIENFVKLKKVKPEINAVREVIEEYEN
ncbi:L-threonine synthase [Marinitoga hydrogenitolerans DSM 16785]|uniref:Threonine synthase n=1 Tax=Marinitoga hydrogenitolerans (strain DSM 16785 / JCM 12826 / AT1271) TaxID=1122195 RepID=A0A1M4T357_MARH1|nr:threonine synthase [Marinitoga hydrogenitolerans]SHE38871.1 L-threonine synthase [Marinitoga hydrogenitolerans DSM 16785]